jgi:hypothetical protein
MQRRECVVICDMIWDKTFMLAVRTTSTFSGETFARWMLHRVDYQYLKPGAIVSLTSRQLTIYRAIDR